MGIKSFTEIEAWQVARQLTRFVGEITTSWHFAHRGLADQMNRASVSVMANIAEGFDAASDSDFGRYLVYSRQSASELQSHLCVAHDIGLISKKQFESMTFTADRIKSMVIAFSRYLKGEDKSGPGVGRRTSDGSYGH